MAWDLVTKYCCISWTKIYGAGENCIFLLFTSSKHSAKCFVPRRFSVNTCCLISLLMGKDEMVWGETHTEKAFFAFLFHLWISLVPCNKDLLMPWLTFFFHQHLEHSSEGYVRYVMTRVGAQGHQKQGVGGLSTQLSFSSSFSPCFPVRPSRLLGYPLVH